MDLTDILKDTPADKEAKQVIKKAGVGGFDISYDTTKADIVQPTSPLEEISNRLCFVKRAIRYAEKFGWSVVDDNFKRILIARTEGKTILSFHEADIAYRGSLNLNSTMLALAFMKFGVMLTEDDAELSLGVFQLRHRYNSGVTWRNQKRSMCSPTDQAAGDAKISELELQLENRNLAVHDEEKLYGFDKEFMKPEWMNWQQFNAVMQRVSRRDPQKTLELMTGD